ncbi:MAG: radical SAM protein, partial [Pseudomonadota bacterium]
MPQTIASLHRARLAREKGAVIKDWGGRISVALVYPNHYRIGMSSLGYQVLYGLFNRHDKVVAERFFKPDQIEMPLYLEGGKGLLSLESLSPLNRFDLIAFSLSFENDYPNILKILELGKIPLLSAEREWVRPLVMAGGVTTFLNPEPSAPFFDFFLIGEAEPFLDEFIHVFEENRDAFDNRQDLLKFLARRLGNLYAPSLYETRYGEEGTIHAMTPVGRDIPPRIRSPRLEVAGASVATSGIMTPDTTFSNKVLIELGRGCGRSCRFCAAGYIYRPPRVRGEEDLHSAVDRAMGGCANLGLLSAAVSDTPGIENLTETILKKGGRFSVSSLRADSLSGTLIDHLKASGQKTIAIAPEAGSERLRKVVNKHLTKDQIIDSVRLIAGK